jgi:two-component system C4-dicarboxylate transport sensor histidine kinase DctB
MEEYVQRFLQLGQYQPDCAFEPVEPASVVNDVLPLIEAAARHAGVPLEWKPPSSPTIVRADRAEMGQLLINLLLNAIEAASHAVVPGGQPKVRVRIDRSREARVRLCVSDSGPGPGPNVRDRLFEPFVSEKADGIGLGLSVVRAISEQHRADVDWVRADGWTHFRIEFPVESSEGVHAGNPGRR